MAKIQKVLGYEMLDSRGNPTVGATVQLTDGSVGTASAPSGASTGKYEAVELRDGDPRRYQGKGVKKAARHIRDVISPALEGLQSATVETVDKALQQLDGTPNKAHLGANATLAVSLAAARALAAHYRMPLFRFLGGAAAHRMPTPLMNILNGGAHARNNIDIQEFMIVPTEAETFREGLRWCVEITHTLGRLLEDRGLSTGVGDEGGFAPDLGSDEEALEAVLEAIRKAGYRDKVKLALDAAASEWAQGDRYRLPKRGREYAPEELISYWEELTRGYPIVSLEDPLGEEDWESWRGAHPAAGGTGAAGGGRPVCHQHPAAAPGHRGGGGERHPHQVQPDRHLVGDPGGHRACQRGGLRHGDLPPVRGDGGQLHRRPGRGGERRADQGRGPLPGGAGGQVQQAAAHRGVLTKAFRKGKMEKIPLWKGWSSCPLPTSG